jgi:Putative Ig domain
MTLNPTTGVIAGTPTTPGTYNATITLTNASGGTTTVPVQIVVPVPITASYTNATTIAGTALTVTPSVTAGGPITGATLASGTLPAGMTLNANGTLTGTPTVPGTYNLTVTVRNASGGTTTIPVTITVLGAPTALNYTTPVTYTSGVAISNNAPAPTGGPVTSYSVTAGTLPPGLTLNPTTGVISGTPTTPGTYSVTVTGSSTAGGVNQVINMTVLPPVTAALTANPSTISVGQSTSLTPIFSGGAGTINNGIGVVGTGGGIPVGPFNTPGTYPYTLTVTNAQGVTATATATITVIATPPNSVSFPVPTTGTTYTYPTTGNPLSGLKVVVPDQGSAVCAANTLTVARGVGQPQPGTITGPAIAVSDPWTISSSVGYPFRVPFTVTMPYDSTGLSATDVPVPFYWDPAYSKWVSVGLKSIDTTNKTVTFTTLLQGQYSVIAIPGLASALTNQSLGYASGTDSWFQPNQGVFDVPGGSSLGMSAFDAWYFGMRKSTNSNAGLYSLFRQGNVNSSADDVDARALISRLANGTNASWNTLWTQGAYQLSDVQTGLAIITGLKVSGQPQIFVMGEARPAVSNAVATAIYDYNATTGKFGVVDPNYPGAPLTITWNSGTGAFTSYDRAAGYVPTFTQYAIEGQTSVHRLADYERVFSGATGGWTNPPFATIAITDVSGTGAVAGGGLVTVPSATNVTITGTISNGSSTATHIYWSQNGGARTPVALAGNSFNITIPALADPYDTRIALETTENPCDPSFSFTGYTEFNAKVAGRTDWFPNPCFETGTTTPWVLEQGSNSAVFYPATTTFSTINGELNSYPIAWSVGSPESAIVTAGNDPNVPSIPMVFDGANAFRANNPASGSRIGRISQVITVPTDVAVPKLSFYWAAVMQSAGHSPDQQPFVDILVEDVDNGYEVVFFKHFFANDPSYPGWIAGNGTGTLQWVGINWQQVNLSNLSARKGHKLRIVLTAADCTQGGHGGYAYLDGTNCN